MYAPSKGQKGFDALIEAAQRYHGRLRALDDAITAKPSDPDPLLAKARFLGQTGTPLQALSLLDQLLQMEPLHRNAIFLKADLLMQGRESDALSTLAPFLAAHPADHEALRRQAIALVRLDQVSAISEDWRDFSGLDKDHLDFSGRRLDKASFRGNRMYFASFAGADLRDADLSGVTMYEADFSGANLAGADLTKAQINQRDLASANLQGADLRGASLIGDLTGADLSSAIASKAHLSSPVGFKNVKAIGLVADGSRIGNGDFADGDFSDANFRDATIWSPRFSDANLSNTDFTGAKFISRDSQMGDLSGADLSKAKLDGVTFVSVQYDCMTKWPAGFNPDVDGLIPASGAEACSNRPDFSWRKEPIDSSSYRWYGKTPFTDLDLSGVSFRGAWLPGTYFWNSNLQGSDFTRAVGKADMRGADLRGADFSYVDLYDWVFFGVENGPANIEGAKFHGATIYLRDFLGDRGKGTDLSKADLKGAVIAEGPSSWPAAIDPLEAGVFFKDSTAAAIMFPGYSLKDADLRGYDLFQFEFGGLDLSGADLRGARLEQVDLSQTQLNGTKLKGACVYPSTPWPASFDPAAAEIIYCSVMSYGNGHGGSDRSSAWAHSRGGLDDNWNKLPSDTPVPDFANETWDEIDWLAAWLPGTNMDGGSFVHTNLKGANLMAASMKNADLTGINFNDALLVGADLTNAVMRDADLRRTSFKDADLSGADLTGALYDDVTVWPAGFDPVAAGAIRQQ